MSAIQRVKEAIEEIKKGNMVIMLDDEDRENEGDLVYCASLSDDQKVNFMATNAKGLICVAISNQTANRLELNPMVRANTSSYETAFTVSVDCAKATTGISAKERDDTIRILANPISKASELVRPGHIFPLIAKDGGVLIRTGHTEGSVDLSKLAGFSGESVICEIMKADGTMARRDDLDIFAKKYNMKQVYISDLVEYRLANQSLITKLSQDEIEFFGINSQKRVYQDHLGNKHTVISFGDSLKECEYVKFHTVIPDIELFLDNDRLNSILKTVEFLKSSGGVIVFLENSLCNTSIVRDFGIGAQILNDLNIKEIKLLTTSGSKKSFVGINGFGLAIKEEIVI